MTRRRRRLAAGYPTSCRRNFARLPDSRTAAQTRRPEKQLTRLREHSAWGLADIRISQLRGNRRKEMLDCRKLKHPPVATQPRVRGAGGNADIRNPQVELTEMTELREAAEPRFESQKKRLIEMTK